jgi:predicted nucleotidyltransferase
MVTLNKNEILKTVRDHQTEIKSFGVNRLALFGSYARGEEQINSDLDFLVELDPKTFDGYFGLKEYLSSLFHREVDLVLAGTLKPRLRARIMGELIDAA